MRSASPNIKAARPLHAALEGVVEGERLVVREGEKLHHDRARGNPVARMLTSARSASTAVLAARSSRNTDLTFYPGLFCQTSHFRPWRFSDMARCPA
jgi:hypothetical protein